MGWIAPNVPAASLKYVKLKPGALPAVIAEFVRSIVAGAHTGVGLVMVSTGFTIVTAVLCAAVAGAIAVVVGYGIASRGACCKIDGARCCIQGEPCR